MTTFEETQRNRFNLDTTNSERLSKVFRTKIKSMGELDDDTTIVGLNMSFKLFTPLKTDSKDEIKRVSADINRRVVEAISKMLADYLEEENDIQLLSYEVDGFNSPIKEYVKRTSLEEVLKTF